MINYVRLLFVSVLLLLYGVNGHAQQPQTRLYEKADSLISTSYALTQGMPDSSIAAVNEAIAIANEIASTELLQRAYYQLGYVYYYQNNFGEADKHYSLSLQLAKQNNSAQGQALALNRLGNVSQLKTNYLKALDYYLEALDLNTEADCKPEVARTLVNLANVYSVVGQYQRSIEHFLQAMEIHEEVGEREGIAWASLGIARLFKQLDLLDRAMEYAQNSLKYYRQIEQESGNGIGVTLCLNEIGSIYHKLGNYHKALEYAQMVLEINQKTDNLHGQAANNISLAIIFLDQGKDILARKRLNEALELKNRVGDSLDLASLHRHLGEIEMRSGNLLLAQRYFLQSLNFAKNHRLIPDISEAYFSLSKVYAQQGNHSKALDAYKGYTTFKDSLNSSDISRLEMQYEFEKREKEQELITKQREALQQAKIQRQRVVLIFFILAFLLTGILLAFIFSLYREKNRVNRLLVEQNIEISNQKEEIETQKEEIEQQRDFVTQQRDQIADQQRLITDSITYASRIQNAVLPSKETLANLPWETFVLYKPKNIVSGDFYWTTNLGNGKTLIAAADCTGHGVPGAFMSMLGITLLRDISSREESVTPADMLLQMRDMVILSLNQQADKIDYADGMDMALAIIDENTLDMEFAGAYQSVIIVRKNGFFDSAESQDVISMHGENETLLQIKGDKMPVGHHLLVANSFTNRQFQLQKGDMLYFYSDGYADQFGGPKTQKFLMQRFRKLLMDIHNLPCNEQKEILDTTIEDYKGSQKQLDDMLVLGLRIS
ncbi:MAG TPA: tetratricopeptide repeat protein [Perlabentimonas sp.]|nr:tetratricopeptide repeat protein [Bacteroidales bacterium]MDY0347542.1 tetratricopeptide repeat protein [Tenuifilaceae bacterium]HZJ74863.1 tetratricopeptide repeat protein [Perlabentimonas sp.]